MGTEPPADLPSVGQTGQKQPAQPGIVLIGGPGWSTMPLATTSSGASWTVTNNDAGQFPGWAAQSGTEAVTGDFSGLGWTSVALLNPGWGTIPVAFPTPGGNWTIANQPAGDFPGLSAQQGVTVLTGDFAKTGKAAIALTGCAAWNSMPLALSNGDGTWAVSNVGPAPGSFTGFPACAAQRGVTAVAGDFSYNGTPRPGIALVGGSGWGTIPMAFAQVGSDGTWMAVNPSASQFAAWAAQPGVQVITGKFSNSGLTDIALLGPDWDTIPVAFANADGSWTVTNKPAPQFPQWAASSGVKAVTGKFRFKGLTDIALLRNASWDTIPVAFANGDGSWTVTNEQVDNFPRWSCQYDVTMVPLHFSGPNNYYKKTAIALTGPTNYYQETAIALTGNDTGTPDWTSIPVAISSGYGSWYDYNAQVSGFPDWASTSGVRALPFQGPKTS